MADVPDLAAVKAYMGSSSYTDEEIQETLDSEYELQVGMCGDRASAYPAPLAEALKRRVSRALALRAQGYVGTDDEFGVPRILRRDPEIVRLEARYRRIVLA